MTEMVSERELALTGIKTYPKLKFCRVTETFTRETKVLFGEEWNLHKLEVTCNVASKTEILHELLEFNEEAKQIKDQLQTELDVINSTLLKKEADSKAVHKLAAELRSRGQNFDKEREALGKASNEVYAIKMHILEYWEELAAKEFLLDAIKERIAKVK